MSHCLDELRNFPNHGCISRLECDDKRIHCIGNPSLMMYCVDLAWTAPHHHPPFKYLGWVEWTDSCVEWAFIASAFHFQSDAVCALHEARATDWFSFDAKHVGVRRNWNWEYSKQDLDVAPAEHACAWFSDRLIGALVLHSTQSADAPITLSCWHWGFRCSNKCRRYDE